MSSPRFRHSGYCPQPEDFVLPERPRGELSALDRIAETLEQDALREDKLEYRTRAFNALRGWRREKVEGAPASPVGVQGDGEGAPSVKFSRLDDSGARIAVDSLMEKFEREGLSLEDTTKLLVRSLVDRTLDAATVRRAVAQALRAAENCGETVMVTQALRHLGAEYDAAAALDGIASKLEVDALQTSDVENRVKAFKELRGWRNDKVQYVLEVYKMMRAANTDTAFFSAMRDLAQTLERTGLSGTDGIMQARLAALPKDARRDVAAILRWFSASGAVDLDAAAEKLASGGKP